MNQQSEYRNPYSVEAEQSFLGAMLISPELIPILSDDIVASDFYDQDHAVIFKAICDLHSENQPSDFLTVAETIGHSLPSGEPALSYIGSIQKNTPSASNAKAYAKIIKERSIDRALIAAAARINEIAYGDQGSTEKIAQAQAEALAIDSEVSSPEIVSAADVMRSHVEELERRFELGGKIDGLETGLKHLDEKLCGMKPEQLIVIAGRPKMGKTTLAMEFARHNAIRKGKEVLVVSLEMSNQGLMDRLLAAEGGVTLQSVKDGSALMEEPHKIENAASKVIGSGLKLSDRPGLTISRIRSMARRHKMVHGLDLLVIDHLGLIDGEERGMNTLQRVSEITRQSKLLAKELKIPVILLSQLNRALEQRPNKRPIPSDLRDSGTIEQDADVVIFVYRDEVYNEDSMDKGTAEIIIGLGRDVEACTVRAVFQGQYNRFQSLPDGYRPPEDYSPPSKPKRRGMDFD